MPIVTAKTSRTTCNPLHWPRLDLATKLLTTSAIQPTLTPTPTLRPAVILRHPSCLALVCERLSLAGVLRASPSYPLAAHPLLYPPSTSDTQIPSRMQLLLLRLLLLMLLLQLLITCLLRCLVARALWLVPCGYCLWLVGCWRLVAAGCWLTARGVAAGLLRRRGCLAAPRIRPTRLPKQRGSQPAILTNQLGSKLAKLTNQHSNQPANQNNHPTSQATNQLIRLTKQ